MDKNEFYGRVYELSKYALQGRDECFMTNRDAEMDWWIEAFSDLHRLLIKIGKEKESWKPRVIKKRRGRKPKDRTNKTHILVEEMVKKYVNADELTAMEK